MSSFIERYSRQLLLPEVGAEGQRSLNAAKILVVGAGGLGSPNILYLAGAGVGYIDIIDGDTVDISNIHRQPVHTSKDIGRSKAVSAAHMAREINPDIEVNALNEWFNADKAREIIDDYDIIVDAVDNFPVKYLINDACVIKKKPFVHAGVVGWKGQMFTHIPTGPCLRCVVPEPSPREVAPTCSRAGILGPMAGIVGCYQALEVIKYLIGDAVHCSTDRLMRFNGKLNAVTAVPIVRRNNCAVCGSDSSITEIEDVEMPICDIGAKT